MKTKIKNKVKLQRGDTQIGNFIIHEEKEHIKCTPLNGIISWRIHRGTAIGILLQNALKEKAEGWLKLYLTCTLHSLCTVPDIDFFKSQMEALNAQVEKHPEYYGKEKPTDDKKADDKVLEEEKQLHEEIEQAQKEE